MPYVTEDGIRIHYEVEGDGPPLVLQHGFGQNASSWRLAGYVDALKPQYRLILVVLDVLHLPAAHFWGYSMGGWIAFGMAKFLETDRTHVKIAV